jgi:hypothetical protein
MNTTSQMVKEARELKEKYFPEDWHGNILYMASISQVNEFKEEVWRFLKKYTDEPLNTTLEVEQ